MNKYKILSALLLVYLVLPNVSLASWWNPTSWFQKTEIKTQEIEVSTSTDKIIEKPVEKIVTKTVTVDNPEQARKIIELQTQLNTANEEIQSLRNKVTEQTLYTSTSLVGLKTKCDENLKKVSDVCIEKINDLADSCTANYSYSSGINTSAFNQYIQNQNNQYQAQQEANINYICGDMTQRRYSVSTDNYCKSLGR